VNKKRLKPKQRQSFFMPKSGSFAQGSRGKARNLWHLQVKLRKPQVKKLKYTKFAISLARPVQGREARRKP